MRLKLAACAALSLGLSMNIQAAPSVAVDIAPLHSLVSQVMDGVGKPKLLIPTGASPHHHSLRPSDAKALSKADVVFWVGEGLTPWLEKALDNVAGSAEKVEVLEIAGTTTYAFREGATFESHDHDEKHHKEKGHHKDEHHDHGKHDHEKHEHKEHDHHGHDKHDHEEKHHKDEHDHHAKEKHAHHDAHKEKGHDEHHHAHEDNDPHAWLDPENAKVWVKAIQDTLSKHDPANADTYKSNAAKVVSSLDALITSTDAKIKALGKPQFIVFHDAYQYFEKRFNVSAAGSISLGDAEDPSPARIKEIRETVKKLGVNCVFTEPQYNPGLVKNVFEGTSVATIGVMDPLGASLSTGNSHYQKLIEGMVNSLSQCK